MNRRAKYPPKGPDTWNAWCWRQGPLGNLDLHWLQAAKPAWKPDPNGEWVPVLVKEVKPEA